MTQQHEKISGYRTLSDAEIDAMNMSKGIEAQAMTLIEALTSSADGTPPSTFEVNQRSLALARTNLQTGFMWLARSIARPNGE